VTLLLTILFFFIYLFIHLFIYSFIHSFIQPFLLAFFLLGNYKWGYELETRKRRMRLLTQLGHEYSLMIGVDCPLGNIQQHAWSMVRMHACVHG
jgi:hypothetical protein